MAEDSSLRPAYRDRFGHALGRSLALAGLVGPRLGLDPEGEPYLRGLVDDLCGQLGHAEHGVVVPAFPEHYNRQGTREVVERTARDKLDRRLRQQGLLPLEPTRVYWVEPRGADPAALMAELDQPPVRVLTQDRLDEYWFCRAAVWAQPVG